MPTSSVIALTVFVAWCAVVGFMAARARYRARQDRLAWERLERAVAATPSMPEDLWGDGR